jgi:hypothetical protein
MWSHIHTSTHLARYPLTSVSLDQHGASLSTLYRQTEKYAKDHRMGSNLLAVKDSDGHVFGVFFNEPIMKREGTYYGSGES